MKTYPIWRPDGWLHGFEIGNSFISMAAIERILHSVDGVSSLNRQFRSDDRLTFAFRGAPWVVHEPFGDNSRYWTSPRDAANHSFEVGPIHDAFVNYKSPFARAWERISRSPRP
jgi:hypothetical protein